MVAREKRFLTGFQKPSRAVRDYQTGRRFYFQMISKRQRRLAAQREFSQPVTPFQQIDFSNMVHKPPEMTRCFRNNRYTVMVFDGHSTSHGPATRVMIQKHDDSIFPNHWTEIQNIKNKCFGAETVAVEYFPAESELQNSHNIYWIWIYPAGVLPIPIM